MILWVNIQVRSPPSWNPVFGTTWLRFSSRPQFRTRARNPVGPRPGMVSTCRQVEEESEIWGQQGFWGRPRIQGYVEATDYSRKLASMLGCQSRSLCHVTQSSAWLISRNQHAFNIKYLANLIEKYWTSQNGHFVSKFPSSVTAILHCNPALGPTWPRNPSWPQAGPGIELGIDLVRLSRRPT